MLTFALTAALALVTLAALVIVWTFSRTNTREDNDAWTRNTPTPRQTAHHAPQPLTP
jgi:hypothetical protein